MKTNIEAAIYRFDAPNINGVVFPKLELIAAMEKFNNEGGFATLEDYPSSPDVSLDRVAATAELVEDEFFIKAKLNVLDTPCGKIVKQLLEHDLLGLQPVSTGGLIDDGRVKDLSITKLAFVNKKQIARPSDLQTMKNWVNGEVSCLFHIVDSDK